MKRFHVHLHVDDLAKSVAFYSKLFAMRYTFCKRGNIQTRFHADVFGHTPEQVVSELGLPQ